jgi:hypothetical protein
MVAVAMRYGRLAAVRVSRPSRDRVVASSNLWPLPCESESGGSLAWIYARQASSSTSNVDRKKPWLSAVKFLAAPLWPQCGPAPAPPGAGVLSGRRLLRLLPACAAT